VGSFAAFATYLRHVLAVLADGLASLTGDLALLIGRHSGETALATAATLVSATLVATLATAATAAIASLATTLIRLH
jgi:hypothetical protein